MIRDYIDTLERAMNVYTLIDSYWGIIGIAIAETREEALDILFDGIKYEDHIWFISVTFNNGRETFDLLCKPVAKGLIYK